LVWLDPRPVREDIDKLYTRYYTHAAAAETGTVRWKTVKSSILDAGFGYEDRRAGFASRSLGHILSRIPALRDVVGGAVLWLAAGRRGRLLDVGSGSGVFLARMRDLGWDVVGIEPDPAAARNAREQFGLDVRDGTVDEMPFQPDTFDAVTMHHVIEHVPDPIRVLQQCRKVLKATGQLIVVTPNSESWGRQVYKQSWMPWDPPRHLFVLSPRTLRLASERAGLQVRDIRTTARQARWVGHASWLIQRRRNPFEPAARSVSWPARIQGLAFQLLEHAFCTLRDDAGEEIVMVATPPDNRAS
jgi:2-polyprenyl-3-methyl-5-hydroxy-6-metoxy-1,4-benzoquinol methylase